MSVDIGARTILRYEINADLFNSATEMRPTFDQTTGEFIEDSRRSQQKNLG